VAQCAADGGEKARTADGSTSLSQRAELGDRPSVNSDAQRLSGLYAAQYGTDVVAQLALGDLFRGDNCYSVAE
jgi:hypothetical protein